MFELVTDRSTLERARETLARAISNNALASTQTISTPGGKIDDAWVYYRPDLEMWGSIADHLWSGNRYFCGFGIGAPTWQPAIEINIPIRRLLSCNGQVVKDKKGDLYLAHKGGLGGGKYSVPVSAFSDLIRGFEREEIKDASKLVLLFVLGRIDPTRLPIRLPDFVREAARIRGLRRSLPAYRTALIASGVPPEEAGKVGTHDYRPENDQDGFYSIQRQIAFKRIHGKVQKGLATELRRLGLSCGNMRLSGNIAPDLFLQDQNGKATVVFEIKVPPGAQSTFTAIGQLIVYTVGQDTDVRRVLVSRGLPASPLFSEALEKTKIEHLRFEIDGNRIEFPDLQKLLDV